MNINIDICSIIAKMINKKYKLYDWINIKSEFLVDI